MAMKSCLGIINLLRLNSTFKAPFSKKIWRGQQPSICRSMSALAIPILKKQSDYDSEEEIQEEELYRYTRYRWLCNESENLAKRYRKFNLHALLEAAVHAVGNGAQSCVKLLKCVEGQYNKAFILTMDNGSEVFAKIPHPNAGPAFYTTASEVATRQFLRSVLHLPIPRIYAYSLDARNPVGAEYIIEERAKGKPLGSVWYQWKYESQRDLVAQLAGVEKKLKSISFSRHGCIYYRKDLEVKNTKAYDLDAKSQPSNEYMNEASLNEFALGPLTAAKLWEGERAMMKLNRGPWSAPLSYLATLGNNELEWAKSYAKPHKNPYRSIEVLETPVEYISLLERYLKLVAHLSPDPVPTSLSHPDLHLDNIFIDPDTNQISYIIDWQSASVSESFFQQDIPRLLLPVKSHASDVTHYADRTANLLSYYQQLNKLNNAHHYAVMASFKNSLLIKASALISGAWSRKDVFSFRHAMIYVAAKWEEVSPENPVCPIQFTEQELELHGKEQEVLEGLGELLHQLQDDNLIPLGGMVLREHYEKTSRINDAVLTMFVDMAESESQKVVYSKVWPYQDHDQ